MRISLVAFTAAWTLAVTGLATGAERPNGFADRMPSLAIPAEGLPLKDVLAAIEAASPAFRYVLIRPLGTPDDVPRVPPMRLRELTVGQFLQVLRLCDEDVEWTFVEGTNDQPGLFTFISRRSSRGDPNRDTSVRVFGLEDLVMPRAALKTGDGDRVKDATDDVLSAVQAALDVAALPGPAIVLKVHRPTLTLIARGTESQLDLIGQTVQALRPSKDQTMAALGSLMSAASGPRKFPSTTRP